METPQCLLNQELEITILMQLQKYNSCFHFIQTQNEAVKKISELFIARLLAH